MTLRRAKDRDNWLSSNLLRLNLICAVFNVQSEADQVGMSVANSLQISHSISLKMSDLINLESYLDGKTLGL